MGRGWEADLCDWRGEPSTVSLPWTGPRCCTHLHSGGEHVWIHPSLAGAWYRALHTAVTQGTWQVRQNGAVQTLPGELDFVLEAVRDSSDVLTDMVAGGLVWLHLLAKKALEKRVIVTMAFNRA